jgi:hypothetical protein
MGMNKPSGCWNTCRCGKRAYVSRKFARKAAKRNHPGDCVNSFRCSLNTGYWHIGHLRPGDRDRDRRRKEIR